MKGKEMVAIFNEDKSGVEVSESMQDFLNNFSFDFNGFLEEMGKQSNEIKNRFTLVSFTWVKKLNYFFNENWFDGRNKYSVNTCERIQEILGKKLDDLVHGYNGNLDQYCFSRKVYDDETPVPFEILFIEQMGHAHRTIQQSFSSVAFKWMILAENLDVDKAYSDAGKKIRENTEGDFYRTPLI